MASASPHKHESRRSIARSSVEKLANAPDGDSAIITVSSLTRKAQNYGLFRDLHAADASIINSRSRDMRNHSRASRFFSMLAT